MLKYIIPYYVYYYYCYYYYYYCCYYYYYYYYYCCYYYYCTLYEMITLCSYTDSCRKCFTKRMSHLVHLLFWQPYKSSFFSLKSTYFLYISPVSAIPKHNSELYKEKTIRGLDRQRTIPTERPPLVDEVSANFSG
jgi:hypothetical protein